MPDPIAHFSHSIEVHLLYASIVWLAAWLLTSMQRGSATTKYWIWVVASLNFLLPLSALPERLWPARLAWFTPRSMILSAGDGISLPTTTITWFWAVWLLGAALMLLRLYVRIRADRRDASAEPEMPAPAFFAHGIPVRFAPNRQGPAVDGVLRPQISLPDGIDRLLTANELNAVLIHELTHARRRDNLIRLLYELSLCVLWFHPLVWITGSRLSLYRELSCDESVTSRESGGDLVSALAKLIHSEDSMLLQSAASSFLSHRLARLAVATPQRKAAAANRMLTITFAAVLLAAALGPAAQSAASLECSLSKHHSSTPAVHPHPPRGRALNRN